ncbi:hypothetical protein [Paraburkholderia terrae]|uniref:hypothetical protein n=1 Tax=Paraburkholderia terrae TaxID=311230 RepID=UPI002FDCFC9B
MDIDENQPQILANRRGVTFSLVLPNGKVTCVITVKALETYFGSTLKLATPTFSGRLKTASCGSEPSPSVSFGPARLRISS